MLFFRSEEDARAWCVGRGDPLRPLVRIDQLWMLATQWYGTRLEASARRPGSGEMRAIFRALGLAGDFWDPQADRFGGPEPTP